MTGKSAPPPPRRSLRVWLHHSRPLRLSWENWRKGYQFRPIRRCRRCDHTSPYHYATCAIYAAAQEAS